MSIAAIAFSRIQISDPNKTSCSTEVFYFPAMATVQELLVSHCMMKACLPKFWIRRK